MTHWYAVHGLVVRSERPLPNGRPCPPAPPDLRLVWPDDHPPAPAGQPVAAFTESAERGYRVLRTADGHVISVRGVLDAELDSTLREARVRPAPGADPGLVEVLVGGFLLAAVLLLRGDPVLHASAVELDGRAVALLGDSGAGKSTVLTLLVGAGALLLSDDVLTFGTGPDGRTSCRAGSTETRLRPTAAELAQRVPGASVRATADGRCAWSGRLSGRDPVPLELLVLLHPSRTAEQVRLEPVGAGEALTRLVSSPRIPGWHGGDVPAQQFAHAAALARAVPTALLTVPWGPPFPDDLGAAVLTAVQGALVPPRAVGAASC